jgi:lipopolysaccharide transport system ATP-binding protein
VNRANGPTQLGPRLTARQDDSGLLAADERLLLRVRDVGKCYEIYDRPIDRLKQTLWRGRRQFFREFWALREASFELARGEALGIIGRNGSGKSTLLQIIAGTLRPTRGQVQTRGRVAALLELGSGFNYEFTGRENVYLNGAVLGLSRSEIHARFEQIAAFADIGAFLDRPVRMYSSGMVVRLAFAVQSLLEPDLLIVDEALAVGDGAFQIKCMNHMRRLLERGVSVLLVTHDVGTVRTFCDRVVWLDGGRVRAIGDPLDVTSRYVQFLFGDAGAPGSVADARRALPAGVPGTGALHPDRAPGAGGAPRSDAPSGERMRPRTLIMLDTRADLVRWGSGEIVIEGVRVDDGDPERAPAFEHGGRLHVQVQVRARSDVPSPNVGIGIAWRNTKGLDVVAFTTWDAGARLPPLRAGQTVRLACELENILAPGEYALIACVEQVDGRVRHYFDYVENAAHVQVVASRLIFSTVLPRVEHELRVSQAVEVPA